MSQFPLVSIIIPCFNSERYLANAIDSVLNQSYHNIELIIVDDCSTDNTLEIIRQYQAVDGRIRLFCREQRGGRPAITKNTGIDHIRGEFVCFLDHDDYYLPGKIEALLLPLLKNQDCVAAFHDIDLVDSDGNFINQYLDNFTTDAVDYIEQLNGNEFVTHENFFAFQSVHYAAIHTISVMIAVERFGKTNLHFDTGYNVCDDTDLWIRLGISGKLIFINSRLAHYRQHTNNITKNRLKVQRDVISLLENNYPRVVDKLSKTEKLNLKKRISNHYSDLGWLHRQTYNPLESTSAYIKAWKWSGDLKHLIHAAKSLFPARRTAQ